MTKQDHNWINYKIEQALQTATSKNQPMTVSEIWNSPDVKVAARSETQVREKMRALVNKSFVKKVAVSKSGVAYLWVYAPKKIKITESPTCLVNQGTI